MTYSLDTNACIRYLNGRSPSLVNRIRATPSAEIIVCEIVRAELSYGAAKSQTPDKTSFKHLRFLRPYGTQFFDATASAAYGPIRAFLEQQGLTIGANDLLIAAIALAHNFTLITHNTREFGRIPGLKLEDWEI